MNINNLEYTNCNICNSDTYYHFDQVNSIYPEYLIGKFNIVKCRKCGLVYVNPRPNKEFFSRFYTNGDYLSEYEPYYLEKMEIDRNLKNNKGYLRLLSQIEKFMPEKGRILEIGMGWGLFLKSAKDNSWQVLGIEPAMQYIKFAREQLQIECINGFFEDVDLDENSFEVVLMDNILEHTFNPTAICVKVNKVLVKDGILIIRVPNINGFYNRIYHYYNKLYDNPRKYKFKSERVVLQHLYEFNLRTLNSLCKKTGFEIIETYTSQLDRYDPEKDFGIRKFGKKIINFLGSLPRWGDQCVVYARKARR